MGSTNELFRTGQITQRRTTNSMGIYPQLRKQISREGDEAVRESYMIRGKEGRGRSGPCIKGTERDLRGESRPRKISERIGYSWKGNNV